MKIGAILRSQQANIYNQLNRETSKRKKQRGKKKEHLSQKDIEELMQNGHVYKRVHGAFRQVK
ncbi:hypothetical protein CLTEP_02380 [Clostridium tepidiprofundi DSM 19306]|uniref:Uncharacterized protein n=1 Tax=Clostridium tepidiprofundi DSM 19306 TaxID=1121338 RepID=A0A151B7E5_9CLOT|nr:hypothetical protein [Clostridium tepidiprofundi]KYH35845.1 hypothetical protein CLTEP_02380 [Clostridium tepidiprofundi DSM 19306]